MRRYSVTDIVTPKRPSIPRLHGVASRAAIRAGRDTPLSAGGGFCREATQAQTREEASPMIANSLSTVSVWLMAGSLKT